MKHIFIINPAAGQGKSSEKLTADIRSVCEAAGIDPVLYETKGVGDAEETSRRLASEFSGEPARFYACGGDGTANEVINGIVGFDHVALGIVPIGTGNDTIRNFGITWENFLDISAQLRGEPRPLDLMHYHGVIDGREQSRFAINMFNNGFDCNVVEATGRMKELPLVSGSLAYLLAIFQMFLKKKGISLVIQADGEIVSEGPILLCAVSNGCYCGGGIKSSPQSIMDDGAMDLNIIQNTTRRRFLKLFPSFAKGEHLGRDDIGDLIRMIPCQTVRLLPYDTRDFLFCADGELAHTTGLTIEMRHHALQFIVPAV